MTSIRRALTLRLLSTLGLMMAAVTIALFLGVRAALIAQFDATLRARVATLEAATRWDGTRIDLDYVNDAMPWYQPGPDAEYFQVQAPTGDPPSPSIVARSPSLESADLAVRFESDDAIGDGRLPDGRPGRMATKTFAPPPEEELDAPGKESERARIVATTPTIRVTVAMSRARLDAALRTVGIALASAVGAMALGLIVGVRLALRAGLAPLHKLSADVEQVRADTLSARLPGHDLPAELRPIHTRLNQLIERLDVAFARERRFASAAAHELRTPVAELRSLLEVSVSRPRTAQSARATMDEALGITTRMDGLVRSLLALVRHQDPAEASRLPTMDLHPILSRSAQRFAPDARRRGGSIACAGSQTCTVRADPAALESILSNVIANAVEYAQPAPNVTCAVRAEGQGSVCIDVANPVRGLTREDVSHFFEPFWRRSESRTDQTHLGLGLAVARALAVGMGAEVLADLESDQILRVRVVLQGEERPDPVSDPALALPAPTLVSADPLTEPT